MYLRAKQLDENTRGGFEIETNYMYRFTDVHTGKFFDFAIEL